jgi:Sec-independent protein secretion pathway component TatC
MKMQAMMSHKAAMGCLTITSFVIAAAITPADPASMLIAFVPIMILAISAYRIGFYSKSRLQESVDEDATE